MNSEERRLYDSIYSDCATTAFRIAYRSTQNQQDAEDLVQNTFAILAAKIKKVMGHPDPNGWLFTTLHHQIQNYWKASSVKRHRNLPLEEVDELQCLEIGYDNVENEIADLLTPKEKRMVTLRQEGYDDQEIAKKLGISHAACRMRFFRLRLKIKDHSATQKNNL